MKTRYQLLLAAVVLVMATLAGVTLKRAEIVSYLLTRSTGHTVQIKHISNIDLGRRLTVELGQIKTQQRDYSFSAEQLILTMGFIQGTPYLDEIYVETAAIIISPVEVSETAASDFSLPALPTHYGFKNLVIEYTDDDQQWQASIALCTGERQNNAALLLLSCQGDLQNRRFQFNGQYGLIDPDGAAEPLALDLTWGDLHLTAEGYLNSLLDLEDIDLKVHASATDNQPLLKLLGVHEVAAGGLNLMLSLVHNNTDYEFSADAEVGEFTITTKGRSSDPLAGIGTLEFDLRGPSLFEFGAMFNEFRLQPEPFSATGIARIDQTGLNLRQLALTSGTDGLLKGNIALPNYPSLHGLRADIAATNIQPALLTPLADQCPAANEPLNFDATIIDNDGLSQHIDVTLSNKHLEANISGMLRPDSNQSDLKVHIPVVSLQQLGLCALMELPDVTAAVNLDLRTGKNTVELKQIRLQSPHLNSNGSIAIEADKDRFNFEADLSYDVPDISRFIPKTRWLKSSSQPVRINGSLKGQGDLNRFKIELFTAQHASNKLALSGDLIRDEQVTLDLELQASGDNLREILNDQQSASIVPQPYSLMTSLQISPNTIRVPRLEFSIAQSNVRINGELTRQESFTGSTLAITASGRNLENVIGHFLAHPVPNLPFNITGEIEVAESDIKVTDLESLIGEHKLNANLIIDKPPNFQQSTGTVFMQGPSTQDIVLLTVPTADILDRPYQASFNLEGSTDRLTLSKLELLAGETDISGEVSWIHKDKPGIVATLQSNGFYLPLIAPSLDPDSTAKKEDDETKRVFSQSALPSSWLNVIDLELDWHLTRLWSSDTYATEMDIGFILQDGQFKSDKFRWQNATSNGDLQLTLHANSDRLKLALEVESKRFPLLWLIAGDIEQADDTRFAANLRTEGTTVAALMAGLNGTMLFKDGAGQIKAKGLDGLFGDFFHNISSTITDGSRDRTRDRSRDRTRDGTRDGTTSIHCSAGGVQFVNGIAQLKPGLVARTDRIDLFTTGQIDLGKEKPDLTIMTRSRTGLGVSPVKVLAPRLRVAGSLAKPSISINAASTALSTGAAFFSGGMSILASAVWDRLNSNNAACDLLFQQTLALPEFAGYGTDAPQPTK